MIQCSNLILILHELSPLLKCPEMAFLWIKILWIESLKAGVNEPRQQCEAYDLLYPFVLVDPKFSQSDRLNGVVHKTLHHIYKPCSIMYMRGTHSWPQYHVKSPLATLQIWTPPLESARTKGYNIKTRDFLHKQHNYKVNKMRSSHEHHILSSSWAYMQWFILLHGNAVTKCSSDVSHNSLTFISHYEYLSHCFKCH